MRDLSVSCLFSALNFCLSMLPNAKIFLLVLNMYVLLTSRLHISLTFMPQLSPPKSLCQLNCVLWVQSALWACFCLLIQVIATCSWSLISYFGHIAYNLSSWTDQICAPCIGAGVLNPLTAWKFTYLCAFSVRTGLGQAPIVFNGYILSSLV